MEFPPRWLLTSSGDLAGDLRVEQGTDGNHTHTYERRHAERGPDDEEEETSE